jgi:hypothetical protein
MYFNGKVVNIKERILFSGIEVGMLKVTTSKTYDTAINLQTNRGLSYA